jgi:hypothetical protein
VCCLPPRVTPSTATNTFAGKRAAALERAALKVKQHAHKKVCCLCCATYVFVKKKRLYRSESRRESLCAARWPCCTYHFEVCTCLQRTLPTRRGMVIETERLHWLSERFPQHVVLVSPAKKIAVNYGSLTYNIVDTVCPACQRALHKCASVVQKEQ